MHSHDVVVIGAGQAGLSVSHLLSSAGIEHAVLEREAIGHAWKARWDSFTLVTPNWMIRLPGAEYAGAEPDAFLPRDEVIDYLARYARSFDAPVQTGVEVTEVVERDGSGYRVVTSGGELDARAVVVASGSFQYPRRPAVGDLPPGVLDLHSSDYRNAQSLPPGAVMVVGSGQSGGQIAEELYEAGRRVFMSVSRAGRMPRRYRGRDMSRWIAAMGMLGQPADKLEDPGRRFAANPHVSGKNGGHTINLHRFARDGVMLVGRLSVVDGRRVRFADDLAGNLAAADRMANEARRAVDGYIEREHIDALPADEINSDDYAGDDGFRQPPIDDLDLLAEGISTVIWSAGYSFDFSWVRPVALDAWGYPVQQRGVTDSPGLYFLGLNYLYLPTSSLLYGVGDDARHVVGDINRYLGRSV